MRPDEDYAEIDESAPTGGSRAMSWMVLAVAVGGFTALAYYAYNSGTKSVAESEAMMVEADGAPIKEAPANPEGEQFADKDKTIYDVISPSGATSAGEKLLPDPEHPVTAGNVEDSEDDVPATAPATAAAVVSAATAVTPATTTFVAKPVQAPAVQAPAVTVPVAPVAPVAVVKPAAPAVVATPTATKEVKSYSSPEMVNEKTITGKKEPVKKSDKPSAKVTSAGGSYMLQLGAFKSETEAQSAWKKISGAHSDVLKGSPTIVKADVNGATFYRLRAGSYASGDAAKAACAKLGGQACFPVK